MGDSPPYTLQPSQPSTPNLTARHSEPWTVAQQNPKPLILIPNQNAEALGPEPWTLDSPLDNLI